MNFKDVRNKDLHWEDNKLFYGEMLLTELIPHEIYKSHYHLKFFWRDEKTPEFFNIINARENARMYSLRRLPEASEEAVDAFK